jgi:hypothetical protein
LQHTHILLLPDGLPIGFWVIRLTGRILLYGLEMSFRLAKKN